MTGRKTAYFVCAELEDDVFIPTNNLNHALIKILLKYMFIIEEKVKT
jgi:ribonuclease R